MYNYNITSAVVICQVKSLKVP